MNQCSICLLNIKDECETNCNHLFCKKCLHKWLDNNNDDNDSPELALIRSAHNIDYISLITRINRINQELRYASISAHNMKFYLTVSFIVNFALLFSIEYSYCCYLDDNHLNDTNNILQYDGLAIVCEN